MASRRGQRGLHPLWWTAITFVVIAAFVLFCTAAFSGTFSSFVPVTVTADRAGLVMEPGAKVKVRGVQVGRVAAVRGGSRPVNLSLELYPEQAQRIPENVEAQIRATTAFGAKYVDLVYPEHPSPRHLRAGAVLPARNVSTEVNTVLQNVVAVLDRIDPPKLNAVLTAFADGVRGQGERIGEATADGYQVLRAVNDRADTLHEDWRALGGFADTYAAAADDIVAILAAASVTSTTITYRSADLDALLLGTTGLSRIGVEVLGASHDSLIRAVNATLPTTDLLDEYHPVFTCMLMGATWALDNGARKNLGGNGRTVVLDSAVLFGDDPYRYPNHLPVVAAKGGPGGKPSCGSLPDATKNFPIRQLITNTGWGTGLDIRPNPGIGHPWFVNFFPWTRAVRDGPYVLGSGPPAIGPVPYPGAPPYGAPMYGPGGVPLWPGVPPAPGGGAQP